MPCCNSYRCLIAGKDHRRFPLQSPFCSWGMAAGLFCSNQIQAISRCNSRRDNAYPRIRDILELFIILLSRSPLLGWYWDDSVGLGVHIPFWVNASCCLQALIDVIASLQLSHIFFFFFNLWLQNLKIIFITNERKVVGVIMSLHILKFPCIVLQDLCPDWLCSNIIFLLRLLLWNNNREFSSAIKISQSTIR